MVLPSGDTSRDIQVPSDVSRLTLRVMGSGSESSLTFVVSRFVVSGGGRGGCCTASNAATTRESMESPDGRTTACGTRDSEPDSRCGQGRRRGGEGAARGGKSKTARVRLPSRFAAFRRRLYRDRKSTRLNSSHSQISYAVFCLKKKKKTR